MGLILDYARVVQDTKLENLIIERSLSFHQNDKNCPLDFEPSGHVNIFFFPYY